MTAETPIDDPLPLSKPVPAEVRLDLATVELPDGYKTPAHVYTARTAQPQPPPQPQSSRQDPVVYLHGIQSHPGWFSGSAALLAGRGHPVLLPTRRGSGANTVARGDAASAEILLEDVATCCRQAMAMFDAQRVCLVGVSWGGKLAAAFCLRRWPGVEVASLTMVAPGIVSKVDVPLSEKLAIGLALLGRPATGAPRGSGMFDVPLSDVELFTDNPPMRDYLARDTYRLHRATARFLYASRRLDSMLRAASGLGPGHGALSLPTTLLLAGRDRIVDNEATGRIIDRLTAGKAHVEQFDAAHTIEFEPDPAAFHKALLSAVRR
jgi:pimeloyl-ACP methyl ester carboxylesterase